MDEAARPSRLTFVIRHLGLGGAQRVLVTIANRLVADELAEIEVVALRERDEPYALSPRIRRATLQGDSHEDDVRNLVAHWRRAAPDVAIAHLEQANLAALDARDALGGLPRVACVEHNAICATVAAANAVDRERWERCRVRYPAADAIVCSSPATARELREFIGPLGARISMLRNPIASPTDWRGSRKSMAPLIALARSRPTVLGVGRLEHEKGFDRLVAAYAHVVAAQPDAQLVLVGDGSQRAALERQVDSLGLREHVSLVGVCDRTDLLMREARLLVVPSRRDASPMVVLEALAAGLPLIATDAAGGLAELLGDRGPIVAYRGPRALGERIVAALRRPPSPLPSRHLARFDARACAHAYLSLARTLAGGRPGRRLGGPPGGGNSRT
jgi:glycosyltransferase involved in cell wall biosynthesis